MAGSPEVRKADVWQSDYSTAQQISEVAGSGANSATSEISTVRARWCFSRHLGIMAVNRNAAIMIKVDLP
jgi:hypothetical protein